MSRLPRPAPPAVGTPAGQASQDRILVVDSDSRLRFRSVDVLRIERDSVILSGGIDNGEQICISSLETFVDGMRVRTLLEPETPTTDEQRERAL